MAPSARVVADELIDIFDHVPEYEDYRDVEQAREHEGDYRLALGRLTKEWGDQLLDLAEHPTTPLTQRELKTIDALLDRISAVFRYLNESSTTRRPLANSERVRAMQNADASILRGVEETARRMRTLRPGHGSNLWLKSNAGPLFRRLHRISRDLQRRNLLLSGVARLPRSAAPTSPEGIA